ncbi:alpha/beta-hydrolase [Anaeromyces robustus]|uniref:Alpha/beta-hydrolase n=1 Tax=Anaeromyces robustus TaxID=1754192 RepID=A0A1Y1XGD7_9FUNG|nr:alpha/beta-hydrolase [Anaeromyces robustus]|eukprot:ORX84828.1 alpha/beta-hydrolase [Anaeromyces robustus]
MKLYIFVVLVYLMLITFTNSNPIEENDVIEVNKRGIGAYVDSIGNYIFSKNIKRNVKYNSSRVLDIYYLDKNNNSTNNNTEISKRPVVIYLYGGIWFLGEKSLYTKLGDFLNDNGYIAVVPNYIQFPYGNADDMISDIADALDWVYNNIEEYGGDNQNLIVIGHSSGAHLTALGMIKSSLGLPSGKSITKKFPPIKKSILLAGPYDFDIYTEKENDSNFEAFASYLLGSKQSCPTDILEEYPDKSIPNFGVGHIIIVQIQDDEFVPEPSSPGLFKEIERTSDSSVELYLAEGFNHCGITEGTMEGNKRAQDVLLYLLLK